MSVAPTGPATAPNRNIGGIQANVTIEEAHRDDIEITQHPVEQNSPISDHAFVLPAEVTIKIAFSNSNPAANRDPHYCIATYDKLRALQKSLQLFTIVTGKRTYQNMLVRSLAVTTDETTENALFAVAICREVILAQATTTTIGSPANMAQSQVTGPTQATGTKQATLAPNYNPGPGRLA